MLQLTESAEGRPAPRHLARRGPRAEELALMRTLVAGPRRISAGPIGRCVKRGWCRALIVDPPKEIRGGVCVLYGLTDTGKMLLGGSEHDAETSLLVSG